MPPLFRRVSLVAPLLVVLLLLSQRGKSPDGADSSTASSPRHAVSALPAGVAFDRWLARYQELEATDRTDLVREGRALAERRRDEFVQMMKHDPEAALEAALPLSELAKLPVELKPFFERPISGVGSVDLLWETSIGDDGELSCRHENRLHLDGQSWELYGAEFAGAHPPQKDVAVNGIALGEVAVLSSLPVRLLSGDELEAAEELFPTGNPDGIDPVTGRAAAGDLAALVGGELLQIESPATLARVAAALKGAEDEARAGDRYAIEQPFEWLQADGGGDPGGDPPVDEGPFQDDMINVLFIRVDFSDFPGAPVSQVDLENTLADVKGHIETFSYNVATIVPTVSTNVYRMPRTGASYALAGDNDDIQTDARALASAHYTIGDYDVIGVFFPDIDSSNVPGSLINYGGLASIGGSSHWINGTNSTNTILHEFGHNYGLYHSNYWDLTQTLPGDYDVPYSREYGDIFDRMGSGSTPTGHFNHFHKNRLQWMPDSKVAEATADGTFRIYRFDDVNALDNATLAVKVPMGGDVYYWVGYRQLYTSSSYNLDTGAYIVAEELSEGAETNLIDATPGSASPEAEDRKDAGLEIGYPFVDSGVTFEALARGGSGGDEWIDVRITFAGRVGLVATEIEVDEQAGNAWLTFQRQFSSSGVASVDFTTSNGTATSGSDYYGTSGTVTWADGDTADKTVAIAIRPDALVEGREEFTVTLSNAGGASLDTAGDSATVAILDPGERCEGFAPDFFNLLVGAIAPLPGGQVLIGGIIYHSSGGFANIENLARLNADGSVDTSFLTGTGFNDEVNAVVVQDDGKILVGGAFTEYNGTACNRLVRLNANGTVDTSFVGNIGTGANDLVNTIAIEADGKILVGGDFDSFDGTATEGLIRLTSAGARDTAYPLSLPFNTTWGTEIHALVVQSDGKIMAGGTFYISGGGGFKAGIARLNADGTRDTSFDPGAGAHADGSTGSLRRVYAILALSDGKYLIGGRFTAYDSNTTPYIARVNSNGSFDGTYSPPAFDDDIRTMVLEPSGKAVVAGDFDTLAPHIVRLNTGGSVDSSFDIGTGPDGVSGSKNIYSLAHSADGALFAGGNFYSFNGSTSRPVVKVAGGISAYDRWVAENFTPAQIAAGDADPTANPDGDSLENELEWALGTPPLVHGGIPGAVNLAQSGGNSYLQLTVPRGAGGGGAWLTAQFSDDLVTWLPAAPVPGTNAVYDIIEDSIGQFVARDKMASGPRRFVRFGAAKPN